MSRMIGSPSIGMLRRSSGQAVQTDGWAASSGRGKSFAATPWKVPPFSTNKNQITGFPGASSVFCHRPATDGSAAASGPVAAKNANRPAKTSFVDRMNNAPLHPFTSKVNPQTPLEADRNVPPQCGDLTTIWVPSLVQALSKPWHVAVNPHIFDLLTLDLPRPLAIADDCA